MKIIIKITSFAEALCYILLGTFIAYYKNTIKINTVKLVLQTSYKCMIIFAVIGLIHTLFAIVFIFDVEVQLHDATEYDNLSKKESTSSITAMILQLVFCVGTFLCFFVTWRQLKLTLASMLVYHDYLITYRLTPRSRIVRKYLPRMTMVMEEESQMDQS